MPAGTVAQWLQKTWQKWTQAPAPSRCPQAQHVQDFMDSMIITVAKLGSRGRQTKVSTVVAAGAPSLGVQPQEPPGRSQAGSGQTIPPLCTGMHRRGEIQPLPADPQDPPAVAVLSCLTVPFPVHCMRWAQERAVMHSWSLHSRRVGWDFPWKECPATTVWAHDILHDIWGAEI